MEIKVNHLQKVVSYPKFVVRAWDKEGGVGFVCKHINSVVFIQIVKYHLYVSCFLVSCFELLLS